MTTTPQSQHAQLAAAELAEKSKEDDAMLALVSEFNVWLTQQHRPDTVINEHTKLSSLKMYIPIPEVLSPYVARLRRRHIVTAAATTTGASTRKRRYAALP